jgi:hypothetical protein
MLRDPILKAKELAAEADSDEAVSIIQPSLTYKRT